MKILMIGDVVGEGGCSFLMKKLPDFKKNKGIDICIANGENSAKGNGVTPESCEQLFSSGVDFITLGNHTYKRPGIEEYLDSTFSVIRPVNYPSGAPGKGFGLAEKGKYRIAVLNLQGTVYSDALDNPFYAADAALEQLRDYNTVLVDFHAEATAEKRAMGFYLDGRVTAVIGTHTHVQTADAQLLPKGTAYITDVGMTGPVQSVLGIEPEKAINKMKSHLPVRFVNATGEYECDACIIEADEKTGKAISIERVQLR